MKYGTFNSEIGADKKIKIPQQVWQKLRISPGDQIEISIKRIKSSRFDLLLSENPLYQLLSISDTEVTPEDE